MATKKPPEEVNLSQAEGEALIERLEPDRLTAEDRRLLVKLLQRYFWLTLALRETQLSLKRLKRALFGKGSTKAGHKQGPPPGDDGGSPGAGSSSGQGSSSSSSKEPDAKDRQGETRTTEPRRGPGRQGGRSSGAPRRWGAVLRTWPPVSGVRGVAGAPYIAGPVGWRSASTVTPDDRPCATNWRSGAVRPVVRSSPPPDRRRPAWLNTPCRRERCGR